MSTPVNRETLELEKLREELLTELSRRHNWQQQERNWEEQASYWRQQERNWEEQASYWRQQGRSWEEQASYWRWQNRLLLGTFILGVLGLILRVWP